MKINSLLETNVYISLLSSDFSIKDERTIHNIITSTGLTPAIKCLIGASGGGVQPAAFNWVGYGTSTDAASTNDVALGGESTRLQDTNPTFPAGGQGRLTVTFGATCNTGAISESGIFNAASGSVILCRSTFAAINKGSSDSVQIIWDLTLSS